MNKEKIEKEYQIKIKELSEILNPNVIRKLTSILSYIHMDRERIKKSRDSYKNKYLELKNKIK